MIKYIIEDMKEINNKEVVVSSGSVNKGYKLHKYDLTLSGTLFLKGNDGSYLSLDGDEIEDYSIIDNKIHIYLD